MSKLVFISSIKNDNLRKKILASISDECLFKAIHEIVLNYQNGKITINKSKKKKLDKFKNLFKKISKKGNKKPMKIKLIKQSGGWLPIIIPTVASILTSLIK